MVNGIIHSTDPDGTIPREFGNAVPPDYLDLLEDIKRKIHEARTRAAISVNRELVLLYWDIGQSIIKRQQLEGWGSKVIDMLSTDLMKAFPGQRGFSPRNLKYMRFFAERYPNREIVQRAVAQIS
jgi:predicted nuclease of restriction endonuclease-like (RecB) superfamily